MKKGHIKFWRIELNNQFKSALKAMEETSASLEY